MNRTCWTVKSRWGEEAVGSLLPVFYSENIVFVGMGGKYTSNFPRMREGDLVLIADGNWIDAIAEVDTPPAQLGHFAWRNEKTAELFERCFEREGEDPQAILANEAVWGARVRNIFQLPREERIHYQYRQAFGRVKQEAVCTEAQEKYERFLEDAQRAKRGLFAWATSELSQDAFFCWLLERLCGQTMTQEYRVASALLTALAGDEAFGQGRITLYRQWANIDILVCVNEEGAKEDRRFLIIEDKVGAELDNDLNRYRAAVCAGYDVAPEQVRCAVIKTEDDGELPGILGNMKEEERPRVLFREELLKILDVGVTAGPLADYVEHLTAINEDYHTWERVPYKDWCEGQAVTWRAWKGFYSALLATGESGFDSWFYVNNPSSSFNAFYSDAYHSVLEKDGVWIYLQLDSVRRELHLKACVNKEEKQREVLHRLLDAIATLRQKEELPETLAGFARPRRVRPGKTMTVQAMPATGANGWLVLKDGFVDLHATAHRLYDILDAIGPLADRINALPLEEA